MIGRVLAGTLAVLATNAVIAAAILGLGLLLRRAYGLRALGVDDAFKAFWLGLSASILLLLLWNFVLPVGAPTLALVLAAGLAGLISSRRELRDLARGAWPGALFLALLAVAALWIANLGTGPLSSWDSGLYHQQGVRWAEAYPAVPGLANLYGALAFNNSSFLLAAMLDVGPWEGRSYHLVNALLVTALLAQVLVSARRAAGRESGLRAYDVFLALLAAPVLNLTGNERISSFDTDVPMTVLVLAAGAVLWDLLRTGSDTERRGFDLLVVTTTLCAAVAVKLSAGVFAATALAVLAVAWLRARYGVRGRGPVLAGAAVLAFALVYVARGVILSGYPLFPTAILGAPVEWSAPEEHALAELAYIVYSGREFAWSFFPRWASHVVLRVPFYVLVPALLTVAALALLALLRGRGARAGQGRAWWAFLAPCAAAAAAWMGSAPDPRYITSAFWLAAAATWTDVVQRLASGPGVLRRRGLFVLGAAFLGVAPLWVNAILPELRAGTRFNPVMAVLRSSLQVPPAGSWFKEPARRPGYRTFVTRSGLTLNVPEQRCWDLPLPCTPNPAPNLRLRRPGDLGSGFVAEGGWEMQSWPQAWRPHFHADWRARRLAGE